MRSCLILLLFCPLAVHAQDLVAKSDAKTPEEERKCFKLPTGFTAQLVVSEPDIDKPMQMAYDTKGRMWVTSSHHYPWATEPGKGTDKLVVLSDFDENGKAKKVTVFDDKLNIPIGVLPLADGKSVIVGECGKILKLTDTDGDGKADLRETLYEGFGYRDTHGMTNSYTLMPDGWVYACHGFANDSKVKGKDGHEITMNSGHTFRFKTDGSRLEVFTRGQVNPFGIAVDPWGNLYTADCHSKPITQLIRGAYYDSFGKPHDGLGYAPHVINHLHDSTGLCGLTYYQYNQFPKEWHHVMFLGNVVTGRINVDKIEWNGSTPSGKALPDFLVSSDPWFRPVDIKPAPDGTLLVADFYNKIIGHYEVDLKHPGRDRNRGRIWRIVYTGAKHSDTFEAPKDAAEIAKIRVLAEAKELTADNRLSLIGNLKQDARLARAAVDVMTAQPHADFAEPLLTLASTVNPKDTHLKHATMVALAKSAAKNEDVFEQLLLSTYKNEIHLLVLFDVAMISPTNNALVTYARQIIKKPFTHAQRKVFLQKCIAVDPSLADRTIQEIRETMESTKALSEEHLDLLILACRGFPQGDQASGFPICRADLQVIQVIEWLLTANDDKQKDQAIRLFRVAAPHLSHVRARILVQKFMDEYDTKKLSTAQREAIIESCQFFLTSKFTAGVRNFVVGQSISDTVLSPMFRSSSVLKLASKLSSTELIQISKLFKTSPYSANVNYALSMASDNFGADLLLTTIKAGEAPARLLQEAAVLEKLKAAKVKDLDTKIKELTKGLPAPEKRIDDLLKARVAGYSKAKTDMAKGQMVFKNTCAACHQMNSEGGKVGPQLDGVGIRGLDRLVEDTLDPSRNVDHIFRQTRLDLVDGSLVLGLLLREDGGNYIMANDQGKEVPIRKVDVEKRTTNNLSAMPANIDTTIPEADYYHLIRYLLEQRAK